MKNVIKQIRKIKGITMVEPAGGNMAVVVFEAHKEAETKPEAVKCETEEQWLFAWLKINNTKIYPETKLNEKCIGGIGYYNTIDVIAGEGAQDCKWFELEGYNVFSFPDYISSNSLKSEWEEWLIGEAKKRYPAGTKFISASDSHDKYESEIDPIFYIKGRFDIAVRATGGVCYYHGKWATIIPEEKPSAVLTEDGEVLNKFWAVNIIDLVPFKTETESFIANKCKAFSTERAAQKWIESQKPKSLTPDQLVDGEIYVNEDSVVLNIFRHKIINKCYSRLFINSDTLYLNNSCCSYSIIRPATLSEKQQLIKSEVEHGYFHSLK